MRVDQFKEMLKGVPKDFEIEVYDSDTGEWVQNFGGSGWIRFVKELPAEELE
jgi:hypothetical protein